MENVPEAPQEQLVNVRDPDTSEIGSIPASQLQQATAQGYAPASPEEVDNYFKEQKYGSTGQQLLTGIEGAAESATFGASTAAERALGVKPEDIRARREVNPGSHTIGSVAGLAGSMFLGTGEGKILSEAGEAAAKGLGLAGETAIGKIGKSAAQVAVESGLMQSGDEISKMISQDPNQSIETAATNIGLSTLLGAPLGGATGGIGALFDAKMSGKAGQFIEDLRGRLKYHLDNPNPNEMIQEELQNFYNSTREAADEVYGAKGLKAQEIQKLMPEKLNDKIIQKSADLGDKVQADADMMIQKPHRYSDRLSQQLLEDVQNYKAALSESNNPSDYFNAMQELKQKLQDYSKFDKFIKPSDEAYGFVQKVKSLAYDARTSLEDESVWGKAAERQQSINKAFKEFLPTLKDFEKKFTSTVNEERVIDPGKINTYVNQLGKPNAELKQEMLGNFLKAAEKYRGVIEESHANLGLESPIAPSGLSASKSSLEQLSPGAKTADAMVRRGLARLGGEGIGAGIGAAGGSLLGHGFLGAIIGEHALGPFFSSILPSLIKPLLEKDTNPSAFKAAVNYGLSVVKGETLINKASKNLFKSGVDIIPRTLIPSEKERAKLSKTLANLKQDETPLFDSGGHVPHYLPDHGTAAGQFTAKATTYLNSLKPSEDKKAPLDSDVVLSDAQKSAYDNALDIAQQPLIILDQVKNGTITLQSMQVLNSVYPSLMAKLQQKVMSEMVNHMAKGENIPYKMRMGLSLFLSEPLDSTMTPQAIQMTQSSFSMPEPNQTQVRAKHSMTALNKLSSSYLTAGQVAESHKR